ncbi:MAG: hypothetical protein WDZ52_09290 [Pseudohongiellaceae bacterium]
MKSLSFALPLFLLLASCTTAQPKFRDMSATELMEHNSTVSYSDQVYCTEEVGLGSHIRRRSCTTLLDQIQGRIGTLNTPSSSQSLTGVYLADRVR